MAEKKKHKPFMESDLMTKGFIEVKPGVFMKPGATVIQKEEPNRIKTFVTAMDVPEKRSKYGTAKAQDRSIGGRVYDSRLEMKYRQHLDLLALAGEVIKIEEQVPYELIVLGKKICVYILDFRVTYKDLSKKWVDVKGMATAAYRIKKKLFEAIFNPITITEIKAGDF